MKCHICDQEAVGRCFTCGALFCNQHGERNCVNCEQGYVEGDPRGDRITRTSRTAGTTRPAWWRPQEAEDFEPPSCYICQRLARRTCRNCAQLFCEEHSGRNDLCQRCLRSAWLGLVVFLGVIALMGFLILLGYLRQ